MKTTSDSVYKRTEEGDQRLKDEHSLERRQMIVLRLLDGATPVSVYEKHLGHFDLPRLFDDLLAEGLITADTSKDRWGLSSLMGSNKPDLSASDTGSSGKKHDETDSLSSDALKNTESDSMKEALDQLADEDSATARYLKRYVPGVSDDSEVKESFADKNSSTKT